MAALLLHGESLLIDRIMRKHKSSGIDDKFQERQLLGGMNGSAHQQEIMISHELVRKKHILLPNTWALVFYASRSQWNVLRIVLHTKPFNGNLFVKFWNAK